MQEIFLYIINFIKTSLCMVVEMTYIYLENSRSEYYVKKTVKAFDISELHKFSIFGKCIKL